MIYIPYNLSTFKSHAKKLKRVAKEHQRDLSTMDCLDLISRTHNAESWNHLFKIHQSIKVQLISDNEAALRETPVLFIEDMNHKSKSECLSEVIESLRLVGFSDLEMENYLPHIYSFYLPMYSRFFSCEMDALDNMLPPEFEHEYTSLSDMYGHMFAVSSKANDHLTFLEKEVLPTSLSQGGLLILSANQYAHAKRYIREKDVSVIRVDEGELQTDIRWSGDVDIETLTCFYNTQIYGFGVQSMHEGRAVTYFDWFFELWERVGLENFPVRDVPDFSLQTFSKMMQALDTNDPLLKNLSSGLERYFQIDTHKRDWSEKIPVMQQEFFGYLTMVQNYLAKAHNNMAGLVLDHLFDDLSKTTIIVCSDSPFDEEPIGANQEKAVVSGVLGMLRRKLLLARRDKILHNTSLPRYLLYSAPFTHVIHRGHHLFSFEFGSAVKTVTSALVEPHGNSKVRVEINDVYLRNNIPSYVDEIEYKVIQDQSSHIINVGKCIFRI
jgi:hypothetical protein